MTNNNNTTTETNSRTKHKQAIAIAQKSLILAAITALTVLTTSGTAVAEGPDPLSICEQTELMGLIDAFFYLAFGFVPMIMVLAGAMAVGLARLSVDPAKKQKYITYRNGVGIGIIVLGVIYIIAGWFLTGFLGLPSECVEQITLLF